MMSILNLRLWRGNRIMHELHIFPTISHSSEYNCADRNPDTAYSADRMTLLSLCVSASGYRQAIWRTGGG